MRKYLSLRSNQMSNTECLILKIKAFAFNINGQDDTKRHQIEF